MLALEVDFVVSDSRVGFGLEADFVVSDFHVLALEADCEAL